MDTTGWTGEGVVPTQLGDFSELNCRMPQTAVQVREHHIGHLLLPWATRIASTARINHARISQYDAHHAEGLATVSGCCCTRPSTDGIYETQQGWRKRLAEVLAVQNWSLQGRLPMSACAANGLACKRTL
jgi:hypothetical protein